MRQAGTFTPRSPVAKARARFTLIELLVAKPAEAMKSTTWTKAKARVTRAAFTLIELLVVVAIIAILAAMLLPVLGQARARAKLVICMGNMKQQAVAFLLYQEDGDGWMPLGASDGTEPGKIMTKALLIDDYSSRSHQVWICPEFHQQDRVNALDGGGYGHTLMIYRDWGGTDGVKFMCHPNAGSFGWFGWPDRNAYGWAQVAMATQVWTYVPWGVHYLIGDSNRTVRVKDAAASTIHVEMFPMAGGWPGLNGLVFDSLGGNARHGGNSTYPKQGNVLFLDGHVVLTSEFGPDMPWRYQTFALRPSR